MLLRARLAALVLALLCGHAVADVIGYSEAFDTLYRINLTKRTATEVGRAAPIGAPRIANIEGLTTAPNGTLFAVSDATSIKTLLTIDPTTGLATVVGPLNLSGGNVNRQLDLGLAFTCDGRLWMSSGPGMFWQLDPNQATARYVGNLGVKVTGLAAIGNTLYGTGSQGDNHLYRIDPATATATVVGAYGAGAPTITTTSPAFDANGNLWAVLDYVPPADGSSQVAQWSDLARIAPDSGTLTNLGPITASGNSLSDLAYIGLKGLALPPNGCGHGPTPPGVDPAPTLTAPALIGLIGFIVLCGGTRSRQRRPSV